MDTQEKKKKEQKGAGVPWGAGSNAGVATQTISRAAQITVRGVVQRSLMATVAHFFSTGVGMLTLTAMVAGTSFFSLWDLNHQRETALAKQRAAAAFQQATSQPQPSVIRNDARGSSNADSLGYLAAANPGGLSGAGAAQFPTAQGGADTSAQAAPQPQAPSQPDANTSNQNKGADAAGQAQAAAQAAFGSRFGQMSTGLGSGQSLAGGAGMSGGVGRAFDAKTLVAQLPRSTGNGSSSGAASSTAGVARTAIQGGGGSHGGNAMGQLRVANGFSQAGKLAGSGEGQSYNAAKAFEGNNGIGGTAGQEIGGTGDQSSSAQTGGAGLDDGSPVNKPSTAGSSTPSTASTTSASSGTDVTPWGDLAEIAEILIIVAAVLLIAASNLINIGLSAPIKHALAWAAALCAAAVTAIGIILMAEYGQMMQGGIFTAVGAITTVLAVIAATSSASAPAAAQTSTAANVNASAGTPAAQNVVAGSQMMDDSDAELAAQGGTSVPGTSASTGGTASAAGGDDSTAFGTLGNSGTSSTTAATTPVQTTTAGSVGEAPTTVSGSNTLTEFPPDSGWGTGGGTSGTGA